MAKKEYSQHKEAVRSRKRRGTGEFTAPAAPAEPATPAATTGPDFSILQSRLKDVASILERIANSTDDLSSKFTGYGEVQEAILKNQQKTSTKKKEDSRLGRGKKKKNKSERA